MKLHMEIIKKQSIKNRVFYGFLFIFAFSLSYPSVLHAGTINSLQRPPNNVGLVGYWTFDGKDDGRDQSGQGNHGKLSGSATSSVVTIGKIGQAFEFDGADDEIILDGYTDFDFSQENSFTIAAWVLPSTTDPDFAIFSRGGVHSSASNHVYYLAKHTSDGNRWEGEISDGTNLITVNVAGSVSLNEWQYMVLAWDGTTLSLYKDGGLIGSSQNTSFTGIWNNFSDTSIGADAKGGRYYFNGRIDDVRVYSRGLSADEIFRLYNAGASKLGVSTRPKADSLHNNLLAHWTFDGKNGFADVSGNGNNLSSIGGTIRQVIGKIGQARSTNSQCIHGLPGFSLGGKSFTITGWWYPTSLSNSSNTYLMSKGKGGVAGMGLYATAGEFNFLISDSNGPNYTIDCGGTANQWNMFTVTFDLDTQILRCYLNTSFQDSADLSSEATNFDDSYRFAFGGRSLSGSSCDQRANKETHVDDVRIYDRVLSAQEIKRLHNIGTPTSFNGTAKGMSSLSANLIGHWTFDGSDGGRDRSSEGNHGELTGVATSSAATIGKMGQAFSFDGVDDYLVISSGLNLTQYPITLSVWTSLTSEAGGTAFWVGDESRNNRYFRVQSSSSGHSVTLKYSSPQSTISTSDTVEVNIWHHIVAVYRSSTDRELFVDGVSRSTATSEVDFPIQIDKTVVGRHDGTSSGDYFPGKVDDVRVYSRALSAEEIRGLYNIGR